MTTLPQQINTEAPLSHPKRKRRRSTSHLKDVPNSRELRDQLRERCREIASRLDKQCPLTKDEMEVVVRGLLAEENLGEGYLGWAMVVLASEFWRDQVANIPPERRLFLLPHCLKHAEGCPADYDEFGLDCKQCGACSIADFRTMAEDMGYRVLVAEGSPIVMKIIVSGYVDAVVGVACLNVLEKAIDKILLAGIPCMAVPLLSSDCRNTSVDEDWVEDLIQNRSSAVLPNSTKPVERSQTYLHLLRTAQGMFEQDELERLLPRKRGGLRLAEMNGEGVAGLEPIAATEGIAYDFLTRGGKCSRPFITLAAFDALTGGKLCEPDGDENLSCLTDPIRRVAFSIEAFHKASLVHDDIQDDDSFRYGRATLHREHGIATAINVGDYLIGLGYRMVAHDASELGADVAADILAKLSESHTRLCEGQGAELLWSEAQDREFTPLDALKIYALKTSPAFEAAFYCGLRMAGPVDEYAEAVRELAKNLGVAFQVLNDLQDWWGDDHNKLIAGGDALSGRPTLLRALANQVLDDAARKQFDELTSQRNPTADTVNQVRQIYHQAGIFQQAERLVDKYQERAEAIAESFQPEPLQRLAYYLIDSVLERPTLPEPAVVSLAGLSS